MTIFAGIFFIVGLIPGFIALKHTYNYLDARDWVAVPATITAADLQISRSDGNDTYLTTAEYNYQYESRSYTGNQVGFGSSSDNIGDFHQRAYSELNNYLGKPQGFNVWVDPENPEDSILYRELRWPLLGFLALFLVIFSGAGVGIFMFGKLALKREDELLQLQSNHPEEPWKWRSEWQNNTIDGNTGPIRWFATIFAVFWNLLSLPLWFVIPREVAKGDYMILIALLFPLVGIGMVIWALRSWQQHRLFGKSQLQLRQMPIALGSMLNAKLVLPEQVPGGTVLKLTLNCIRRVQSSGSKKKTSENIIWQTEQEIQVPEVIGRYTSIPIRIQIPANQPPADADAGKTGVIWRLLIDTDIPGVDYQANFELPVFDTGMGTVQSENYQASTISETGKAGNPANTGVIIDGQRYWFPPGRHKLAAVVILVFGVLFAGGGVILATAASKIFGGIFVAVGGLILWGAAALMFKRSEIRIEGGSLIAASGWFGVKEKLRLPSFKIKKLWIKSNMSVNNVKFYDLYLNDQQGNKFVLASNLKGRRDCEALVALLAHKLGISNAGR